MWAAIIPAIVQGITALQQMSDGQDKANAQRPEYKIPEEVSRSLAIAKANYADQTMPGESRMMDQNNLAAANAVKAITEGGGSLSAIAGVQAQQSKFAGDILTQSQNYQRQDEQQYQQLLGTMADYKDQAFQMNKFAPYAQNYAEGRQEVGAGLQNLYGSLNSIANVTMANSYLNGQNNLALQNGARADALQTSVLNQAYGRLTGDTGGQIGGGAAQVGGNLGGYNPAIYGAVGGTYGSPAMGADAGQPSISAAQLAAIMSAIK